MAQLLGAAWWHEKKVASAFWQCFLPGMRLWFFLRKRCGRWLMVCGGRGAAQADVDAAAGAREAVPEQRLPRAALPRAARDAQTRRGPPGGPAPRRLPGHATQPERPGQPARSTLFVVTQSWPHLCKTRDVLPYPYIVSLALYVCTHLSGGAVQGCVCHQCSHLYILSALHWVPKGCVCGLTGVVLFSTHFGPYWQ